MAPGPAGVPIEPLACSPQQTEPASAHSLLAHSASQMPSWNEPPNFARSQSPCPNRATLHGIVLAQAPSPLIAANVSAGFVSVEPDHLNAVSLQGRQEFDAMRRSMSDEWKEFLLEQCCRLVQEECRPFRKMFDGLQIEQRAEFQRIGQERSQLIQQDREQQKLQMRDVHHDMHCITAQVAELEARVSHLDSSIDSALRYNCNDSKIRCEDPLLCRKSSSQLLATFGRAEASIASHTVADIEATLSEKSTHCAVSSLSRGSSLDDRSTHSTLQRSVSAPVSVAVASTGAVASLCPVSSVAPQKQSPDLTLLFAEGDEGSFPPWVHKLTELVERRTSGPKQLQETGNERMSHRSASLPQLTPSLGVGCPFDGAESSFNAGEFFQSRFACEVLREGEEEGSLPVTLAPGSIPVSLAPASVQIPHMR